MPTRSIPILIGGGGERKTLKIVAEHADIWHSFADPETLAHKIGVLQTWCAEVGRDPDEIELSTGVSVRGLGSDRIAVLEQHYELGVRLVQASIGGPDFDYEPVRAPARLAGLEDLSRRRRHRVVPCPFLAFGVSPAGPTVNR